MSSRALSEFGRQFASFLGVGGAATAVQYLLLILLVETLNWDPVWASATGFGVSAVLNYYLNYRLTFRSTSPHRAAVPKFVVTVSGGLTLNTLLMHLLVDLVGANYLLAQVLSTGVVLFYNFFLGRVWIYQDSEGADP